MTDWPRLIQDIKGLGVSAKGIERLTGVSSDVIYNIANGRKSEPTHAEGQLIIWLHDELQKLSQNCIKTSQGTATA